MSKSKSDFAKQLAAAISDFTEAGGEVKRYASSKETPKIKLGAAPILPVNQRDEAWNEYIEQLKAGTYVPEKEPESPTRRPAAKRHREKRYEDFRGWKS